MVLSVSEPDGADQSVKPPPNPPSAPYPPSNQLPVLAPPVGNVDLQSALLAILSKATSAVGANGAATSQIPPNTTTVPLAPTAALDANQLALLQHLAQTAKGIVPSQPAVPVPASVVPPLTANAVPVVPPVGGPPQPLPLPYRDDHYGPASAHAPHRESEQQHPLQHGGPSETGGPPDHGYPRDDYYYDQSQNPAEYANRDPRRGGPSSNQRGGYYRDRGGPGRGRGRGRWDNRGGDRDSGTNHNYRDRHLAQHNDSRSYDDPRGRRGSRSRSPPGRFRNGGMGMNSRDARLQSPPRRPAYLDGRSPYQEEHRTHTYGPGAEANIAAGFDEFGRELRAGSPSVAGSDSASASASLQQMAGNGNVHRGDSPFPPRSTSVTTSDRGSVAPESASGGPSHPYSSQYPPNQPSHSSTSSATLSPSSSTVPLGGGPEHQTTTGGLDKFDRASFDPSQPASWEALGKAWMATHGSMPSQEELMRFVLGDIALPPSTSGSSAAPNRDQHDDDPGTSQEQRWQQYGEGEQGREQWNSQRGSGQRGGWRGRGGGDGDGAGYRGQGRGYGRGRGGGDFGRGGYGGRGRGDYGRGGYHQASRGEYGSGPGPRRGRGDYHRRDDYGHGYGRGEDGSGYGDGNSRGAYAGGRGYNDYQDTDAVTLTGDGGDYSWQDQTSDQTSQPQWQAAPSNEESTERGSGGDGGGSSGRMQKVGDKWVFVRGAV